jgi:hypothetical protein
MESLYHDIIDLGHGPHFRLITLRPSASSEAPIDCVLSLAKLSEDTVYEALSYCWGDASNERAITCNGEILMVTENLEAALVSLRLLDKPRIIWVDAVCINQNDLIERAQQVSHMRSIYQLAERVIVWIGLDYEDSETVFPICTSMALRWIRFINGGGQSVLQEVPEEWTRQTLVHSQASIERRCKDSPNHTDDETTLRPNNSGSQEPGSLTITFSSGDEGAEEVVVGKLSDNEYRALMRMLKRPWWTRSWVVQEICLAKAAILVCGTASVDWDVFTIAVLLSHDISGRNTISTIFSNGSTLALLRVLVKLRDSAKPPELPGLLSKFRSLQATDPRDKVFAFLGLLPSDDPALARVQPDYEADVVHCYVRAAVASLQSRRNLDILLTERHSSLGLSRALPSWVPDWSTSITHELPLPLCSGGSEAPFSASGSCQDYFPIVAQDDRVLLLTGLIVDEISEVEAPLPPQDEVDYTFWLPDEVSRPDLDWAKRVFGDMGKFYTTYRAWERLALKARSAPNEDPLHIFCTTICAGNLPLGLDTAFREFSTWRKHAKWPQRIASLGRLGLHKLSRNWYYAVVGFSGFLRHPPYSVSSGESFFKPLNVATTRRLARTRDGRLALVPQDAMVGDKVAVCQGGKLPFILRSMVKHTWELVGCSYVHGIMYGEAWDEEKCVPLRLA